MCNCGAICCVGAARFILFLCSMGGYTICGVCFVARVVRFVFCLCARLFEKIVSYRNKILPRMLRGLWASLAVVCCCVCRAWRFGRGCFFRCYVIEVLN